MRSRLLVIDNYDSFTFNLVQMFLQYDLDIWVFRSDKLALNQVSTLAPNYLLVSPGPKDPAHAGISIPIIREWHRRIPILGVCLGMQCINEVFQGADRKGTDPPTRQGECRPSRRPGPVHGLAKPVYGGPLPFPDGGGPLPRPWR